MQRNLPIFPEEAKLISQSLGVYVKDDIVQSIVNGLPVYTYQTDNRNAFRFITSNFIHQGLCRKMEFQVDLA